jgi:16S rRNA (cytidine1402-2'-O)-methyltransferase
VSTRNSDKGLLSIVATPIGNLEDITLRAVRTLREADLILAEDTRRTRVLCQAHDIHTPLKSFHAHSSERDLERLIAELHEGKHLALVTDAGTPLVSDPGSQLVRQASEQGLRVEALPGASAVLAALTVSAIACDSFRFVGFLPRSGQARRDRLNEIVRESAASVLFESPQRIADTLADLQSVLAAGREVAVCRELTKLHEEVVRGSIAEVAAAFAEGARGEITLIVAGKSEADAPELSEDALDARIRELLDAGSSVRDVARMLSTSTTLAKHVLYARVQALKDTARTPT